MSFDIILSPRGGEFEGATGASALQRSAKPKFTCVMSRKTSRNRIKRLRELRQPQYRLRVGEVRVFYDIVDEIVEILAIVASRRQRDG